MDARLPAHVEASALIRQVNAAGGFAAVLHRGERDAGTLLIVLCKNGTNKRLYERMPQPDGDRRWSCAKVEDIQNKGDFSDYLTRRTAQDPDAWIVELDIADGERFIP